MPRLGFDWPVAKELTIKGGAYFALTPACAMGGGRLEVLFHAGAVKAWFIAHADFIIFWKPFFFDASIGVSLGVSVTFVLFGATVTLALELGAEVELWGPPTGGLIHVSLFIISFTIRFGEEKPSLLPTLSWDEFKNTLPQGGGNSVKAGTLAAADDKTTVVSISIGNGLLTQTGTGDDLTWFVRPDEFEWFTKTTIPATSAVVGAAPVTRATPNRLSWRPHSLACGRWAFGRSTTGATRSPFPGLPKSPASFRKHVIPSAWQPSITTWISDRPPKRFGGRPCSFAT